MGRFLALLASLLLAVPSAHAAPAKRASAQRNPAASQPKRSKAPSLAAAVAAMKSLMRDRQRRQYRHNWERAIDGLLAAARGKDAGPGYLEAARARYALYRWSADERDRDKALINANRAAMRGLREGRELAAAIRREAGDDRPAVASRPKSPARHARAAPPPVRAPEREPEPEDEESPPDPTLAAALVDLEEGAEPPALKLGEHQEHGTADVTEVRTWSSEGYSRVAVYLSHWVGWQKIELPAVGDQPRRIAFDFRPARLAGKALTRAVAGAQIDRVRAAQNDAATVRVVLDLPGTDEAQVFSLDDPPRLVIDVGTHPSPPPAVAQAEAPAPGAATAETERPPAAAPTGPVGEGAPREVRRIVIDAGHGGRDPGAIGRRGLREKAVTLDIAKKVAADLKASGFEVILPRTGDRFLPLEDRTAIANTAGADLFVSIHANANPRRNRSGIETYFLNVTDDRYAARLAARENGGDVEEEGGGLQRRILADLNAVTSAGSSRHLASLVQRELTRSIRGRFGEVRDLGVKSALFYVLLGARMPAVLVETGFISNAAEEKRLASPAYRDEVARAVSRAVRTFARGDERVAAAR